MASSVIGALRVDLGIDTAAFSDGLKSAGSKLGGFGAALRSAILPIVAIGTTAAVGIGAAVKGTINAADEMSKAAQKFGIPTEELSRLKYAADLSDVSLETLGTSVGLLSKKMVAAGDGNQFAADSFAKAGIEIKNVDGSLKSASEVLDLVADAMAGMPDGAEKTALAMELLGRGGKDMIPLLNGGAQALRDMKAEADTFGQVFTTEMGAQAEQFNDNLTRLGGAFGSIAADLTEKLLPYLTEFTDWLVENGPRLADVVVGFVNLGAAVIHAGQAIVGFVADTITAVRDFAAQVDAIFRALPEQLTQIGRDMISGLVDGLKAKWGELKSAVTGVASGMVSTVKGALGIQSPSKVFAEIGRNVMAGLQGGLEAHQTEVQNGMQSFAQGVADTFAGVLTGAVSFKEGLRGVLADTLGNAGSGLIQKGLGAVFGSLFPAIPGFANGTNYAPGGLALVGERGPEIVNMRRGSQVIPNRDLNGHGGGAMTINVNVSGARGNSEITEMVQRGVSQGLSQYDAGMPARVQGLVSDPRRRY